MLEPARVSVHLTPRAAHNEIRGWTNGRLSIRVTAPPVDGKANEALIALVAKTLAIARSRVRLVAGATSRHKTIEIDGLTIADIRLLLSH